MQSMNPIEKWNQVQALVPLSVCPFLTRIIASQCYAGFCHTSACISHRCTHAPPSWTPPSPHPTTLGGHRARSWAPCIHSTLPLAVYFTYGNMYVPTLLPRSLPSSPEGSQKEKDCILPHVYGIQKDSTDESICRAAVEMQGLPRWHQR